MFPSNRLNHKDKVILTAALTGAVTTKENNPALPTTPDEIVASAIKCYEAGAAVVHIHVREEDESASMRYELFEEVVTKLRATGCPVV
ncbi:MAG: 3-keto-5-aminohexanoate cleavage protein, partial [Bacillota bacterium]|nr:3-keto-5-aminohexanoate cleavage protein [Bacillota bacterium]